MFAVTSTDAHLRNLWSLHRHDSIYPTFEKWKQVYESLLRDYNLPYSGPLNRVISAKERELGI